MKNIRETIPIEIHHSGASYTLTTCIIVCKSNACLIDITCCNHLLCYSYSTGSLLADLVNLGAPEGAKEKLPVVWNAYISGLIGSSGSLNVNRATTAINQAFAQSPYLKK